MHRKFTLFVVAGMVLGVLLGWACNQYLTAAAAKTAADDLNLVTYVFLRLIRMIIAPLVFSTLVAGIAKMEDAATVGRVGGRALFPARFQLIMAANPCPCAARANDCICPAQVRRRCAASVPSARSDSPSSARHGCVR